MKIKTKTTDEHRIDTPEQKNYLTKTENNKETFHFPVKHKKMFVSSDMLIKNRGGR